MSESDDTDLLLLIPPDFFAIHSDSEDSLQSLRRNSDHRFTELISQVNELEERVNFIESKDTTYSESVSETNRINQSIDYSLFDTSNFHNVHGRDVALRFYSLASAGFQFECSDDNSSVQYLEPCIMTSSENKHHNPQTVSPVSDFKSEGSVKCVSFLNPDIHSHAHSLEPSNHLLVNSSIPVNNTGSRIFKCTTANEDGDPYKFLHHSQPFNFSFLSEIDEFLEKKNKLLDRSLHYNGLRDCQRKKKINQLKISGDSADSENEFQPFIKLPSTDPVANENKYFDVDQEGKSQINEEVPLHQQYSDTYIDVSCMAEPKETNVEKNRPEFNDLKNEKDFDNENTNREYFTLHKELNSAKFSKDAMYNSYGKFLKENSMNGVMDERPACNNRQSSFITGLPCLNDMWVSENSTIRPATFYSGEENSVNLSLKKNTDDRECENNQFLYQNSTAQYSESLSKCYDNSFDSPINKSRIPFTEGLLFNKNRNFPHSPNELYQARNVAHCDANSLQSKHEKDTMPVDAQSCGNNDITSNLKICEDKLKNGFVTEFGSAENSKLPQFSLDPNDSVEIQHSQKLDSMRKEIGKCVLQSSETSGTRELSKGCIFISDNQSVKATPKLPKGQSMDECILYQDDGKNVMPVKAADGISKTAPVHADDGYYSSVGTGSSAINFLSLSNLWGRETKQSQKSEVTTVEQKLEEEHYRRKHCENVIQKLQCTILELQQKLAVALRVDQSKDHTIQQLQTAWKRLVVHWQELEEQRHTISVKYSEEKEKHQQNVTDIMQKVKQCELELSKALDLAKGYKERNEMMEKKLKDLENFHLEEKQTLQVSLQEKQKHFLEAEEKLYVFQHEMTEVKEKLEAAEKKVCEEMESSVKFQEEMKNIQHLLGNLEGEKVVVKQENEDLRLRLKEERARNNVADQQIKSLKLALDESKKNEKILQGKLKEQANTLEKTKAELRDYYQHQVEFVVQEKLVEFQTQLDAAEASLHQEMEQREKLALEAATKQIKHITEKNLLEVKLLEEKHREELHLCKLQIVQATQKINQLQSQLQSYSNRKIEIVEKLHTVMETQWQEALRIISGSSPLVQSFQEQQHIDLEKDISESIPDRDLKPSSSGNCNAVPPLLGPPSSSSSTTDDIPFSKEDQLTYRANNERQCNHEVDIHSENSDVVKKYIEMLLNRPPGDPLEPERSYETNSTGEICITEGNTLPNWGKIMENQQILSNTRKMLPCSSEDTKCIPFFLNNKLTKPGKPPWK